MILGAALIKHNAYRLITDFLPEICRVGFAGRLPDEFVVTRELSLLVIEHREINVIGTVEAQHGFGFGRQAEAGGATFGLQIGRERQGGIQQCAIKGFFGGVLGQMVIADHAEAPQQDQGRHQPEQQALADA